MKEAEKSTRQIAGFIREQFKKKIARKKIFIVKIFGLIKRRRHADFICRRLIQVSKFSCTRYKNDTFLLTVRIVLQLFLFNHFYKFNIITDK